MATTANGQARDLRIPGFWYFGDVEEADPYLSGTWVPCPDCDDWFCTVHQEHAHECACPPVSPED